MYTHHWIPAGGSETAHVRVRDGAELQVCPAVSVDDGIQWICVVELQPGKVYCAKEVTLAVRVQVACPGTHGYGEDVPIVGVAMGPCRQLYEVLLNMRDVENLRIKTRGDRKKVTFTTDGGEFTLYLSGKW